LLAWVPSDGAGVVVGAGTGAVTGPFASTILQYYEVLLEPVFCIQAIFVLYIIR
jgi:hypothetical protein